MRLAHSSSFSFSARLDRFTMHTAVLAVVGLFAVAGSAEVVPLLEPGFFFDYNIPGQAPPIPITEQCQTINIKWGRRAPNAMAPYSMVVYTSTFTTPFTIDVGIGLEFDWQVPFAPGTQYQICMWDTNGVPGGCQAMYTVIQNSTVAEPTCQNVTFPTQLQVDATDHTGPLSQFGFTDQCTDIKVTPKSGKPPYTLTVAPPLHPPFNITSNSMSTIDWTVSLPWSYPFFLSLQSADGQLWHFGPLHGGGFGPTDCCDAKSKARALAVGAGIGSAFGAGILAALAFFLFLRLRRQPHPQVDAFEWRPDMYGNRPISQSVTSRGRSNSQSATEVLSSWTTDPNQRARTYAPVTVITADQSEVVELPPRYHMDLGVESQVRLSLREKAQPPLPQQRPEAGPSRSGSLP
ncbi:hypothetical protein C8F01DRAFT_1161466 [Mycena amicta]|nr:hypothetical protein C8F01DRAFT_1161466 [Mycena amicta]